MNNLEEKYMSYNPKDIVFNNARVCFNEKNQCWIAPGKYKLNRSQAEKLAVKIDQIMVKK
jgi:N-acetylneuraminic acid mutarotase